MSDYEYYGCVTGFSRNDTPTVWQPKVVGETVQAEDSEYVERLVSVSLLKKPDDTFSEMISCAGSPSIASIYQYVPQDDFLAWSGNWFIDIEVNRSGEYFRVNPFDVSTFADFSAKYPDISLMPYEGDGNLIYEGSYISNNSHTQYSANAGKGLIFKNNSPMSNYFISLSLPTGTVFIDQEHLNDTLTIHVINGATFCLGELIRQ